MSFKTDSENEQPDPIKYYLIGHLLFIITTYAISAYHHWHCEFVST